MGLVFQQNETVKREIKQIVDPLANIPINKMTNEQLAQFFPVKTHKLTDPWGHTIAVVSTRQKTVYDDDGKPFIWSDANIAYLEAMNDLIAKTSEPVKPKKRVNKKLMDEIAELTGETVTA